MELTVYVEGIARTSIQYGIIVNFHDMPEDFDIFNHYFDVRNRARETLEAFLDSPVRIVRFFIKELGGEFPHDKLNVERVRWSSIQ